MLTLARIATDKGPRVLCLRGVDPSAHASLADRCERMAFLSDVEDLGGLFFAYRKTARYDRAGKRMVVV